MDEILKRPESKTLEFKREIIKPDRLLQSISAFANAAGGEIWIGVDDKSRMPIGLKDPMKETVFS